VVSSAGSVTGTVSILKYTGATSLMEIVTTDSMIHVLAPSFVQKSKLLCDVPPGPVPVPFSSKLIRALETETYPADQYELMQFARAADFLQMDDLLDESARRIAQFLNGQSAEKIWEFLR
jgi:hypothetical protein